MKPILRASVFALSTALGCLAPLTASADEGSQIIENCQSESEDQAQEIECLRNGILLLTRETSSAVADAQPSDTVGGSSGAPTVPNTNAQAVVEASAQPTGLGAEQVIARSSNSREAEQELQQSSSNLVIEDFAMTADNRLVLVFDNDHVWVQSKGDTQIIALPEETRLTASVKRGAISGYRIQLHELNRVITAERVR